MAGINEYSKNPSENTSINGINIAEGCLPGNVNDGMRQQMADTISAHTYVLVTVGQAMVNTQRYLADTTAAAFTLTLPGNPTIGDRVTVRDAGDWAVNNLTIGRNGNTIGDDPNDLVLDITGAVFEFVWDGSTWEYTPIVTDSAQLGGNNTFTGNNTFSGDNTFSGSNTFTGTVTLVNPIDEFSTDGTLADDSDTAVPTEKAVKTYVDSKVFETDQIADGSVTTVKIADDSVTLDKIADGAGGEILVYSDTGAPTLLDPAADGHVLTSTGAGLPPEYRAPAVIKAPTIQVFTASGTWTRPEGCTSIHVEATGGGGGGVTASTNTNSGAGGGAGGTLLVVKDVTSLETATVTVGTGGAVNVSGVDTSFDTHVAPAGLVGSAGAVTGGLGGSNFSGENTLEIVGGQGMKNNNANYLYGTNRYSGGGSSKWGGPGAYGSGGNASGAGTDGVVVVTEYYG